MSFLFKSHTTTPDITGAQQAAAGQAQQTEDTAGGTLADELALLQKFYDAQQAQYDTQNKQTQAQIAAQDEATRKSDAAALAASQKAAADTQAQRDAELKASQDAAMQARADATDKAKRIQDATDSVNQSYAGYDDAFYQKFAQQYIDARKPTLEAAADEQQRQSDLKAGHQGIGVSSAAARQTGFNQADRTQKEGALATDATSAAQSLKSTLFGQQQTALQTAITGASLTPSIMKAGGTAADYPTTAPATGPAAFTPSVSPPVSTTAAPAAGSIEDMLAQGDAASVAQSAKTAAAPIQVATRASAIAPDASTSGRLSTDGAVDDATMNAIRARATAAPVLTPKFSVPRENGPTATVL